MRIPPKILWLLTLLLLVLPACALDRQTPEPDSTATIVPDTTASGPVLPEIKLPDIEAPAGAVATAQAALEQAGEAAGTAVQQAGEVAGTVVKQAGDAAGTAAVVATEQGGSALATVQAISTPDLTDLTQRLAALRPDDRGNLSVTLDESELNQFLRLRYLVMSSEPELRDASVRFADGVIELGGVMPLPLPVGIGLSMRPLVIDGRFELEVIDASLGPVRAPQAVRDFAGDMVTGALEETIGRLPDGFHLQSIVVEEGTLTISGKVNSE